MSKKEKQIERSLDLLDELQGVKASSNFLQSTLVRYESEEVIDPIVINLFRKPMLIAATLCAVALLNAFAFWNFNLSTSAERSTSTINSDYYNYEMLSFTYSSHLEELIDE